MNVEVENVHDLKIGAIHEHQVAAYHDVRVVRRRRRKHHFEFMRAWPHLSSQINRQISANHYLTLQAGRKPVALGQSWWKMLVMRAIPAAGGVAIVIGIAIMLVTPAMFVFTLVAAFVIVAMAVVMVIIIAVVFFMAAIVIVLRQRD
jgi:hypothetical protein